MNHNRINASFPDSSYSLESRSVFAALRALCACLIMMSVATSDHLSAIAQPAQMLEVATLVPDSRGDRDEYGLAAAISDGYAVVGAPRSETERGRAYVFERGENGTWVEVQQLQPPNLAFFSNFGTSVDIDGGRLLVGATYDDGAEAAPFSGAAYVFERQNDGTWLQTAKLIASDAASEDEFGTSVALDGDRALIGAPEDDDRGENSGSAYVFDRETNGTWTQSAKLMASDGTPDDLFGRVVDVSGDFAVIGAPFGESDHGEPGTAFVFERQPDGSWIEAQEFIASDANFVEEFGFGVAVHGTRALIGAPAAIHFSLGETGAAFLYERQANGEWMEIQHLTASDRGSLDYFGYAVALSNDRAVIGARRDYVEGERTGSAYVYQRVESGEWIESVKLLPSDPQSVHSLGFAVSLSGDHVLLGASDGFATGPNSGSAYVFALDPIQSTSTEEYLDHPSSVVLHGNYPNPFNPSTRIEFALPEPSHVRLAVYDMLGREVARLFDAARSAGAHSVLFEAGTLPGGTYLYRLETESGSWTRRMVLVK